MIRQNADAGADRQMGKHRSGSRANSDDAMFLVGIRKNEVAIWLAADIADKSVSLVDFLPGGPALANAEYCDPYGPHRESDMVFEPPGALLPAPEQERV